MFKNAICDLQKCVGRLTLPNFFKTNARKVRLERIGKKRDMSENRKKATRTKIAKKKRFEQ
jgi:hypothetical protein